MGHKGTKPKDDAKKFSVCPLAVYGRRFRLWSPHRERCLAIVSRHDHFPVARSLRDKRAGALTLSTPDRFDKRRVRWSFLKDKPRASASQVASATIVSTSGFYVRNPSQIP